MSSLKSSSNDYQKAYPVYNIQPEFEGYSMNNKYTGYPPLMSDGRSLIAGYTPEAVLNAELMKQNGIANNWQYRQYMSKNTEQVQQKNFNLAANDIGYIYRSVNND